MTEKTEDIKKIRLDAGLSRPDVCKEIGIPLRTLESWESDGKDHRDPPDWVKKLYIEKLKELANKKSSDL